MSRRTLCLAVALVLVVAFLALFESAPQPIAAHTDHYLQLRPQHSAGNGMCMNVEYGWAYGGEKIILWPCVGAQNEQFTVLHKSDGWHEIKARHSNMCLEVPNGSLGLVQLRQNPCNGQSYQRFQPASCTGCAAQIRIKHSGQCVNVEGWGGQNARVIQYPCQSPPTANETWLLRDNPPPYAHSWYITQPGATDMYNLGRYVDGPLDNSTCANSVVVLNFGQPDYVNSNYGTNTFANGNPFISNADIRIAVENYARGWYQGTGTCPRLTIVAGTNNYNQIPSGQGTPSGAGSNWATLVYAIQSYLDTSGYSWQISAWGGSDMEQPSGGELWDCASDTRQFVDGYNGNSLARKFLNYGTAWVPNACWTAADVHYVSYGAVHNWPLPEAYFGSAVDTWVSVRISYSMYFEGVMTTCSQVDPITGDFCQTPSGWFTPSKGWQDLWDKLIANGVGQSQLNASTNIRFQP